jgi:hypothetical protein
VIAAVARRQSDDETAKAGVMKRQGREEARRAGADDDDVTIRSTNRFGHVSDRPMPAISPV